MGRIPQFSSSLHAQQGRAGVCLQSWRQHAAKPVCQGQWEEREEMLRKSVFHYCTDMGKLPMGEPHTVRTVKSVLKSELGVASGGYGNISV